MSKSLKSQQEKPGISLSIVLLGIVIILITATTLQCQRRVPSPRPATSCQKGCIKFFHVCQNQVDMQQCKGLFEECMNECD